MTRVTIASVVEGEGEVAALPKVLQRIARELQVWELRTPKPHRVPRSNLLLPGGIENAVRQEAIQVRGSGGVLVLLDADKDCPAMWAPCCSNVRGKPGPTFRWRWFCPNRSLRRGTGRPPTR